MVNKVKILWFSSSLIKDESESTGHSWIHSLANHMSKNPNIELFNICLGRVSSLRHHRENRIQQWEFPTIRIGKNGLPSNQVIKQILAIVDSIKPDLIHYWGTENFWPLLNSRGLIKVPALLEIQGLKFTCFPFFYVGMSTIDRLKTLGIRELIKPDLSIFNQKKHFKIWGEFEKEMIRSMNEISVQSDWVVEQIKSLNTNARLHRSRILLRSGFSNSSTWNLNEVQKFRIFTSATSSSIPYKGLHVLVDAVNHLKKYYPKIHLVIAGFRRTGIRKTGYERWVERKIQKFGLSKNITWVGQLTENDLITELKKTHVCAVPSFIESYSLAMDEALTLGVPTVASNAAAMPELANCESNCLLAIPGDASSLAGKISRIFDSEELSISLSRNAIESRRTYHKQLDSRFQKEIYSKVLNIDLDVD